MERQTYSPQIELYLKLIRAEGVGPTIFKRMLDSFAMGSHLKWEKAARQGKFDDELAPMDIVDLQLDASGVGEFEANSRARIERIGLIRQDSRASG